METTVQIGDRDPGVAAAIKAAGGVTALARMLGISHASVCEWAKVPAKRVIQIELALDGKVKRENMRPDLYP